MSDRYDLGIGASQGQDNWYQRLYEEINRDLITQRTQSWERRDPQPKCALNGVEIGPPEEQPIRKAGWWEELMNSPEAQERRARTQAMWAEMDARWAAERKAKK